MEKFQRTWEEQTMDFRDQFRKVSDDVGKMAREVADNSKKQAARVRIRRMINNCNDVLVTTYSEIGAKYYTEHFGEPEAQYAELFERVDALQAQLEELRKEQAGLDKATICPSCGSKVNDMQKFCPECGAKNASYGQMKAEAEAEEAARRAAKEAQQAERAARKAEKAARNEVYDTTAEAVLDEDDITLPVDAEVCMDDE